VSLPVHAARLITKQITFIPGWELKTYREIAEITGHLTAFIANLFYRTPKLMRGRARERKITIAKIQAIPGWESLSMQELALHLGMAVHPVKKFFQENSKWRPARTVPWCQQRKRIHDVRLVDGWETKSHAQMGKAMGISSARFGQIIRQGQDEELRVHFSRIRSLVRQTHTWSREQILGFHEGRRMAEEAARAMGVPVRKYRQVARSHGIVPLPGETNFNAPSLQERLKASPNWRSANDPTIARALGISTGRVRQLFISHPELLAQRKPSRLPNRKPSPPRRRAYPHSAQVIRKTLAIPRWETKTFAELGRNLGRNSSYISFVIRETPELARQHKSSARRRSIAALIAQVKDWQLKSYREIGQEIGKRPSAVRHAIQDSALVSTHQPTQHLLSQIALIEKTRREQERLTRSYRPALARTARGRP
jgi:alkylated DNA nucleotide flippase Atl1